MFKQDDSSNRRKNKRLLLPTNFSEKVLVGFCLSTGKRSLYSYIGVILKPTERTVPLKLVLKIFKIALLLRDREILILQSLEFLNVFSILTSNKVFRKTKTFKKLEYCF